MNVTCDKCNKRYSIADDKVRGKSVKIRCKQCQNLISVQGPASGAVAAVSAPASVSITATPAAALGGSPWEEERTRAMPMIDATSQWFAMVKGKQLGPFDVRGLEGRVKTGELTLRTYLWRQGMGDWKRASDVPEVSQVFAGVSSAGATATGPTSAAPAERPSSKKVAPVQRDVAVALETPSPEIVGRKTNGNGNGSGAAERNTAPSPAHVPAPAAAPAPAARAKVVSQAKVAAIAKPAPSPAPAPTAPMPAPEPVKAKNAPLSDLFSDPEAPDPEYANSADIRSTMDGDGAEGGEDGEAPSGQVDDPFAALGESDPSMAPPPGEATKFFIAQAGVNKRNPPWKIALFVLGGPAAIVGVLFILSSLHIVPLEVTHTNEKGEEVKESFFSAGGVSGLKDMLSGDAKKKKEEAEKARLAAAEARRKAQQAQQAGGGTAIAANDPTPDKPKPVDPALALIYGKENANPTGTSIHVRRSDREGQQQTDTTAGGLTADVISKVVADKLKAFQSCIETALHRNPNLAVGSIEVVANVAPSGVVTQAFIDPKKYEASDWGGCMRDVAKRIVFPKSEGETEVRIPLKVGVAVPL